jgi:hypothetical protein
VARGAAAGVAQRETSASQARHFTARYERGLMPIAGHFISREMSAAVVQALLDLR